jgi:hypothetical protein
MIRYIPIILILFSCVKYEQAQIPLLLESNNNDGSNINSNIPDVILSSPVLTTKKEDTFIQLDWNSIDSVVAYDIYRSTTDSNVSDSSNKIARIVGNVYRDFNVVNYTTYYYGIVPLYATGDGPISNISGIEYNDDWQIKWVIPQSKIPYSTKPTISAAAFRNYTEAYAQSIIIYDQTANSLYSLKCIVYLSCASSATILYPTFSYSESISRITLSDSYALFTYNVGVNQFNTSHYLSRIQPSTNALPSAPTEKQTFSYGVNINQVSPQSKGVDFDTTIYTVVSLQTPPTLKIYYAYAGATNFTEVGSLSSNVGLFPRAINHKNNSILYVIYTNDANNLTVSKFDTVSKTWISHKEITGYPSFNVTTTLIDTTVIGSYLYFVGDQPGFGTRLYEYDTTSDTISNVKTLGYGVSYFRITDKYLVYSEGSNVHVLVYPYMSSVEIDPLMHSLSPPAGKETIMIDVRKFYDNSYNFFYWTNEDGVVAIKVRRTR